MPERSKPARGGSRRKKTSPLQKPFEPGSQDELPPLTTPVVVVEDPDPGIDPTTTIPGGRAREHVGETHTARLMRRPEKGCAGPGWETEDHQHQDAGEVARHLELFFAHTWPDDFVREFGVNLVNAALAEIPSWKGIKRPAAYLTRRVRALSQGALPIDAQAARPERYTQAANPEAYIAEYVRRRGHLPWEEPPA